MLNLTSIYIAVSVIAILIIAVLVFFLKKNKKQKRLSPLVGLSFVFVIAGIVFIDDRLISYSLFGVGIALAVIDIIKKLKSKGSSARVQSAVTGSESDSGSEI